MEPSSDEDRELTGRSRFVSNVVTSWISQVLLIIAGFFLPRFIDQHLGQVLLGIWDLAWSITSYISLSNLGIGAALNRYVAKHRANNDPQALTMSVSTTALLQFAIAAAVAAIAIGASMALPKIYEGALHGHTIQAQQVVLFLGLSVAFQLLFDTSRGVLTGCHHWGAFNTINSGTQILGTLAMILILVWGGTLRDIAIAYAVMILIQGVIRSIVARRICPDARVLPSRFSRPFAREIIGYGIRSIAINVPFILTVQGVYVIVASVLGPAALAILARPIALIRYIETFISRFTFVLTPMAESVLAIEGKERLQSFAKQSGRYSFAFAVPAITLFAVFGEDVIRVWMGADYVNRNVIWILSFAGLFLALQGSILRIIIGLDLHGQAAGRALILALAILATALVTGKVLDAYSLEYFATTISLTIFLINGILIPTYACRKLEIPFADYLRALISGPVVAAVAAGAIVFATKSILAESLSGWRFAYLIAGYGVVIGVIYFRYLLPPQFRERLLHRFAAADGQGSVD